MKDNLTSRIAFDQIQDLHRFLLAFSLKKNLLIHREKLYSHDVSAVDLKNLLGPVLEYIMKKKNDPKYRNKYWKTIL